jgi:cytoskeletal protein RodZ
MGSYLRAARRRRRVSIERAAEETRIRADYLMRMESDEFDFLAPAYVHGFLKTYARFLRIEPQPLLEEFDRKHGSGRFETQQIIALERHGRRHTPKEPRLSRSWSAAAVAAAGVLLILAVVGLVTAPDDEPRGDNTAVSQLDETPTPTVTPSASVTPSTSPSTEGDAIAFTEGIEVEVIASEADCWVQASADGGEPVAQTLSVGDSVTFTAEDELYVRLGFPEGVELVVNGRNIGSPQGVDPINLTFPDDIDLFL